MAVAHVDASEDQKLTGGEVITVAVESKATRKAKSAARACFVSGHPLQLCRSKSFLPPAIIKMSRPEYDCRA